MKTRAILRRGHVIAVIVGSATLLWGCGRSSPSVVDPHSPESSHIAGLFWLMLWMGIGIYVVVLGFVFASFRQQRRHPSDSDSAPKTDAAETTGDGEAGSGWAIPSPPPASTRRRSDRLILGGGLALPLIALTVVGIATVQTTNAVQPRSPVIKIDVEAERWWWRLTYPSNHVVTANEIHVPVGQPVQLTLTSDNVIHSVWVPELDGKTDVIPGQTNQMTFTANAAGTYRGQCAEFCGIGHALMAFVVIADAPVDYERWLSVNAAPAAAVAAGSAQRGANYFVTSSCAGCHTVAGTAAVGTLGPDLTHFGSRTSIAADTLPNTPTDLGRWLSDTQGVKRGALMPQIELTPSQVTDLVSFLEGLR